MSTAEVAREALADIAASACDGATPERMLDCFAAAEEALNRALTPKRSR